MSNEWLQQAGVVLRLVSRTVRLMVGVGDYEQYVAHMQSHHPDAIAMSEKEYFRYCQSARYPGKDGSIKRCPC
ncbi:MAG TPA: YbdD/YjiX family protein [Pseudomonadales bacterium]|nr:YbdD/YjiX family protein [Pseudomonadales bacterium]